MMVDLSVLINEKTPVYPGDPSPKISTAGILEKDGFCDHLLSIGTHLGTHMDAPIHMLQNGKSLDSYSIERFVGTGWLVDAKNGDFSGVRNLEVGEGDIVLFHTDMSKKYFNEEYFTSYPAMDEMTAQYLVGKKVSLVGIDTCSVDNQDGFPIHKALLNGDVLIVENLTNLEQLEGKKFKVYSLPIRLDIDGSPARVIAEVTNE